MNATHTPGPWQDTQVRTIVAKGDAIANCNCGQISGQEQDANAKLIAAAPELLEALDNLAREVTTLDMFGETGNTASKANVDGALDQARAAIAKATT
jgi:hypothetical protein